MSYSGHLQVRWSYPSAKMQLVYSAAPPNWVIFYLKVSLLILVFRYIPVACTLLLRNTHYLYIFKHTNTKRHMQCCFVLALCKTSKHSSSWLTIQLFIAFKCSQMAESSNFECLDVVQLQISLRTCCLTLTLGRWKVHYSNIEIYKLNCSVER